MKALELGKPELSFELLRNHAELLYHPGKSVINSYLDYFRELEDFEPLKEFFKATKSRYMIQRPVGFHCTVIHKAFAAGDKANVINAYLDILDYDKELAHDSTIL